MHLSTDAQLERNDRALESADARRSADYANERFGEPDQAEIQAEANRKRAIRLERTEAMIAARNLLRRLDEASRHPIVTSTYMGSRDYNEGWHAAETRWAGEAREVIEQLAKALGRDE